MRPKVVRMWWRRLPLAVSGLILLLSMLNLLGWLSGTGVLIEGVHGWTPMVPMASFLLILSSLSLICSRLGWYRAGFLCAAFVFVVSAAVCTEYLLDSDFGIDNRIIPVYPPFQTRFPGRFSPNSAVCFLLVSAALAVMNRPGLFRKAPQLVGLLGSIVYALGFMAMLGYFFGVEAVYNWDGRTGMALCVGVAFMAMGLLSILEVWTRMDADGVYLSSRWIPLSLAAGTLVGSAVFWRALIVEERKQMERILDSDLGSLESELSAQMRIRLQAIDRMAQRWDVMGPLTRDQWAFDAELNRDHFKGYRAIAWCDTSLRIRWVVPASAGKRWIGLAAGIDSSSRRTLDRALGTGGMEATGPLELPQVGRGFLVYQPVPVATGGSLEGLVVGVFSYREVFEEILPASFLRDHQVGIYQEGERVYPDSEPFPAGGNEWVRTGDMALGSARWTVRIRPRENLVRQVMSRLPSMALAGGAVISMLLAAALHFGQVSRRKSMVLREANRELELNRENFSNIVMRNSDGILVVRDDGIVRFANPAGIGLIGRPGSELVGTRFPLPLDAARGEEIRLDGTDPDQYKVLELSVTRTDWEGRKASLVSLRDVTDAVKMREALHHTERNLKRLVDSNIVAVFIADAEGYITEANDAFCSILGYSREDILRRRVRWQDLTPPEFLPVRERLLEEMFRSGHSHAYEKACLRKDGSRVWNLVSAVLLDPGEGLAAFMLDIDDRKRTEEALRKNEEQLRQAQKMDAVGRLAGGVAHDFNNLLTAINGYAELLGGTLEPDSPHRAAVDEIRKAGERAASLTKQLLAFSRKQVVVPKVLEANAVVSEMASLVRRLIGENIDFDVVLDPDAGRIRADAGLVQQMILNLAINGRDAMPGGGRMRVETSPEEIQESGETSEAGIGFHLRAPGGRYTAITVRDSGTGMDESTLSHLFEPFFSTKEKGKGTGLGLSTVYGIVQQLNGAIRVESRIGEGSVITVFLPRVEEVEEESPAPERDRKNRAEEALQAEPILLVEDEEVVRGLARNILTGAGYSVSTASNGEEAIRIFHEREGAFGLLLTDVIMPGMSGRELARRIREMKPGIRVVFISGYTDDESFQKETASQDMAFLAKPFSPQALLHTLEEALRPSALRA